MTPLSARFEGHLRTSGLLPPDSDVILALSGGLDSVVLLDLLLALRGHFRWRISAAHFDHRMRPDSAQHADWVRELCENRGVAYRVGLAGRVPASEADARELRYRFLFQAREELGAEWLATAHQADDQAETVLFRLRRGAGLRGVAGIPAIRAPKLVRPLLPFWRQELVDHAERRGLESLADPSNLDLGFGRNWIRHRLVPALEAEGNPHLRHELYHLASLAARAVAVVDRRVAEAAGEVILATTEGQVTVARTRLLAYDTRVRAHLLRALLARVGPRPNRSGTRIALEFVASGLSGHAVELTGGSVVRREFDRLIIERRRRAGSRPESSELAVADQAGGSGEVMIDGVRWRVRWSLGTNEGGGVGREEFVCFDPSRLHFPLTIRGWRAGDRIRLRSGTRKLKRVFVDRKVGRSMRAAYPIVADGLGVLAVVGLVRGVRARPHEDHPVLSLWLKRLS